MQALPLALLVLWYRERIIRYLSRLPDVKHYISRRALLVVQSCWTGGIW